MAGLTTVGAGATILSDRAAIAQASRNAHPKTTARPTQFNIRDFGATGDGHTIDTPAINAATDAAANVGGGTVLFPAGIYASYSVHLRSNVALYLDAGATLLAAPTPHDGLITGGYDAAEPQNPAIEPFQDYGHNHWHNSLLWGEDLHDLGIFGPGLIWGKGLSHGRPDPVNPDTRKPGVGNKTIALKNCRNVILSDFSILEGGWFGLLATGVDNLSVSNLKIDTNRDGLDIDCCRNVRISNCTVNSPWDDGICPKSSFALGYARATELVTISDCFVTGGYELGSVLDGTWRRRTPGPNNWATGRIKCGTESNGGFKIIAISNCVFESCQGFALETEDGAICEDITLTGITMRDIRSAPLFLRLGSRLRGPKPETVPGSIKRVLISNVISSGASRLPSSITGIPGHPVEDIKISDVYLHQVGGAPADMASIQPPENEAKYPEPTMFGDLPATGLFARHVRNLELSNVEIATASPDPRPAFSLMEVDGADFFRLQLPRSANAPAFHLANVTDFRVFGCRHLQDKTLDQVDNTSL